MSKIIVLIGASGSGKSTLDNHLRTLSSRVQPVTSLTTREKRESDAEGDYEYLNREEFAKLVKEHKLLWSASYGGNFYGTSGESVLETLDSPTKIGTMVLVPKVIGVFVNYLKSIDRLSDVHFYYVDVRDEVRKERLRQRGESEDVFIKRLEQDKSQKQELFKNFGNMVTVLENNGDLQTFLQAATEKIKVSISELAK